MCCLLFLAVWQIFYLRRFFQAKKLIEWQYLRRWKYRNSCSSLLYSIYNVSIHNEYVSLCSYLTNLYIYNSRSTSTHTRYHPYHTCTCWGLGDVKRSKLAAHASSTSQTSENQPHFTCAWCKQENKSLQLQAIPYLVWWARPSHFTYHAWMKWGGSIPPKPICNLVTMQPNGQTWRQSIKSLSNTNANYTIQTD